MQCGIIGLPNVGKSTLFNALIRAEQAQAKNYPFCTIDPNVGRVGVFDTRLEVLAQLVCSTNIIPAYMEFVDIAGLVRGASHGEGLGNQFLSHIRSVDAILHVVRCFESDDIIHVDGALDPKKDIDTIQTELLLADLSVLERRLVHQKKKLERRVTQEDEQEYAWMIQIHSALSDGKPARLIRNIDDSFLKNLGLLTAKPMCYVCNVSEHEVVSGNAYSQIVQNIAYAHEIPVVLISAAMESALFSFTPEEAKVFLESVGLTETGLEKIVLTSYSLLQLITFFTVGRKEVRAWPIVSGSLAPQAASVIHSDFEKGFIRAEIITYDDYIQYRGSLGAKNAGKARMEGQDYIIQDGDIVYFHFS